MRAWKHSLFHERVGENNYELTCTLYNSSGGHGPDVGLRGGFLAPGISEALPSSVLNASSQPELGGQSFLVAHLDEDDRDDDWKDEEGHRKYKKCHRNNRHHFCGHKSLDVKTIQDLKFGKVVGDSQHGGTVVIHADTGSKTVNQLYDAGGFHSRAEFEIIGKPEKKFVISLLPQIVLPSNVITKPSVESFTVFPSSMGTFGPDGKARVYIGATLKLGPIQQGGEGSGSVPLYVDYVR